jgi:hypothetical protein
MIALRRKKNQLSNVTLYILQIMDINQHNISIMNQRMSQTLEKRGVLLSQ